MKSLGLIIATASLLTLSRVDLVVSQKDDIKEHWEKETVIPPEASTFQIQVQSGVNSGGDLNLSIPIMTVPGRGGLDFPLTMTYGAGIKTRERPTWVGLGWNLEIGVITRQVRLVPDYDFAGFGYYTLSGTPTPGCDYRDFYHVSSPWLSGVFSLFFDPVNQTFDMKFHNSGKWKIARTINNYTGLRNLANLGGNTQYFSYDADYFVGHPLNPVWKNDIGMIIDNQPFGSGGSSCVSLGRGNRELDYSDFGSFTLTGPDGTRYVYGTVLKSEDRLGETFVMEFNSNWRLSAILSYDYVDDGDGVPNLADAGNWIRIEYEPTIDFRLRPFKNPNLLQQQAYVSRIVTPTHEAEFILSDYTEEVSHVIPEPYIDEEDSTYHNAFKLTNWPRKLDEIVLTHRSSGTLVQKVRFEYLEDYRKLCGVNQPFAIGSYSFSNLGKLTLGKVVFVGRDDSEEPGYSFEYHQFNPPYFNPLLTGRLYEHSDSDPTHVVEFGTVPLAAGVPQLWFYELVYPISSGEYFEYRTDRFGYLHGTQNELIDYCDENSISGDARQDVLSTSGAVAYSLNKIFYPTGGSERYRYESDRFSQNDKDNWGPSINNQIQLSDKLGIKTDSECGIRVIKKTVDDGIGNSVEVNYEYGNVTYNEPDVGRLASPPTSVYRFVDLDKKPRTAKMFNWNVGNTVEYEYVDQVFADGGKTRSEYYNTSYQFYLNDAYFFRSDLIDDVYSGGTNDTRNHLVVETNDYWSRGILQKTEHYDNTGFLLHSTDFDHQTHEFIENVVPNEESGGEILQTAIRSGEQRNVEKKVEIFDPGNSDRHTAKTTFEFNEFGIIKKTVEHKNPGVLVTKRNYVVDLSGNTYYNDFRNRNLLDRLASINYADNDQANAGMIKSTSFTWADFGGIPRLAVIEVWRDEDIDTILDPGEQKTWTQFQDYDNFGNPLSILDANGVITVFSWGQEYEYSKLTQELIAGFQKTFTYTPSFDVESITDENGKTQFFEYDSFWRLKKIRGYHGEVLREIKYHPHHVFE